MIALAPNVTGEDIADWIGRTGDVNWMNSQGDMFANVAREAASAYCRGIGFEDPERVPASLHHVIRMRAVRMAMNYSQLVSQGADSLTMLYGAAGQGFTLQEQQALNDYRIQAA